MDGQEKIKMTYTKEMIIKKIADVCKKDTDTVRAIYNALEDNVAKLLSTATPQIDVSIRLFKGVSIDGVYVPEKRKLNNLTGSVITAESKIRPKANITRSYCEKITSYGI